jgi:hypothetical protein
LERILQFKEKTKVAVSSGPLLTILFRSDMNIFRRKSNMAKEFELSKETFLSLAEAFGLDTEDPHMEELYSYVQKVLPNLRSINELDLTGLEPNWPNPSSKG